MGQRLWNRRWMLAMTGAVLLGVPAARSVAQEARLGPRAVAQIEALVQEKLSRTPAQRKISSGLLFEVRKARRDTTLLGLPSLRAVVEADREGRVLVDVTATVTEELLERIEALGGMVVSHFERYDAIRARLPLGVVEALAREASVRSVRPADALSVQGNVTITEGDTAHKADVARANFDIDGTGVRVGAMSDSVDELAALQALGELPPGVTVLPGQAGGPASSEGTALLEIIHDMAPGVELSFATGSGGLAQMATNIMDLAAAGCDVIVDDVGYFIEGAFQDDIIAQAVEAVTAQGVLYFSSAGNSGNFNDGTSGVWEGSYSGMALPAPLSSAGMSAHDFGGGNNANTVTEDSLNDAPFFTLQWNDPIDGSGNDYDLYLLDATLSNVLDASTNVQDGDDRAFEAIDSQGEDDSGNRLVVVKFAGSNRFLHLNGHRSTFQFGTDGQIFGHTGAKSAFAVAAVRVPAGGGAFDGTEEVETFSSDGPRRIFFNADGSPALVARVGMTIPEIRDKPDVGAADGVMTESSNFSIFFGTSASAPHAAAIGALMKEIDPGLDTDTLRGIFASTSLDIEAFGFDRDSGFGIIDADTAVSNQTIFSDGFESGDTSAWTHTVP